MLLSCGNDVKTTANTSVNTQDTTLYEQAAEFRAINDMLKEDINNSALYLKRANLFKKYGDLSSAVDDIDRALLKQVLLEQYEGFAPGERTQRNLEILDQPSTYTVTTGHQLVLFG